MFWKALVAFLAMPGVLAFAVPGIWLWHAGTLRLAHPLGLVVLGTGTLGLLWCVGEFYVQGKGTLAPWSPPQHLVTDGLYRVCRNPMYVSVLLVLVGWAASFASAGLIVYALVLGLAFHLRVVYGEEPWLARKHGARWQAYAARVPRWCGFASW